MWIGIGAFMLEGVIDKHVPGIVDTALEVTGWVGTVGGTAYKLPATREYVVTAFGPSPDRPTA
jgi:hypothetical protein